MTEISDFARLAGLENGLGVVTTVRPDRSIQASVVNAGVLRHPRTGADVVGFVAIGGARKLANLRADPHVTVVARSGWQWVSVEGLAEVTGPDDGQPPMTATRCGCCSATSSRQRAAPTTTGTPTTGSWARSAAPQC
jgi:hypothetical protein